MKEVRTTELPRKNHHFMLKCMAALTSVAVASTVALLAFSAKSTAFTAASATLVAAAAPAAAPFVLPILPIAAVMFTLGGVCLLPFLFGNSCRNPGYRPYATAYATTPSYQPTFYSRPSVYTNGVAPTPYVGHHHSHHNAYAGHHHHGHGNGIPHVETHSGSHYHSHR